MGRKKSTEVCPKCGEHGFVRWKKIRASSDDPNSSSTNKRYFVHKNYLNNGKTVEHYIENLIEKYEYENIENNPALSASQKFLLIQFERDRKGIIEWTDLLGKINKNILLTKIDPEDDKKYAEKVRKHMDVLSKFLYSKNCYLMHYFYKDYKWPEESQMTPGQKRSYLRFREFIEDPNTEHNAKMYYDFMTIAVPRVLNEVNEKIQRLSNIEDKDKQFREIMKEIRKQHRKTLKLPFFNSYSDWFEKYERPRRKVKQKILNKKLSESGFGSDKQRSQYSGIE